MKNQSSGAGKFISGHMYYFDPMDTTDGIKGYTWMARARKEGGYTGLVYGGGGNATTTAYTGIKITTSKYLFRLLSINKGISKNNSFLFLFCKINLLIFFLTNG